MFDIGYSELLFVALVALVVIGPKELPNVLRKVGRFTGKARAMTRHLRAGFDEMVRQAEIEDMEKEWQAHNARIMAEHPGPHPDTAGHTPDTMSDATPDESASSDTPAPDTSPPDDRPAP